MFRKTRKKIVITILVVLIVLMAGTLGIIYGFSYYQVSERNKEMLQLYMELYSLKYPPGTEAGMSNPAVQEQLGQKPMGPNQEEEDELTTTFELSTFYSVAIDVNGQILATDNHSSSVYSNEELIGFAEEILAGDKPAGVKSHLIYKVIQKDGYVLVGFMNNQVIQESMSTLFRCTLLFGSIGIFVLFCLSFYWSKKIVEPLEENYHKQKQFISDAGHELKTPVAVINTNAELLQKEIGPNQWLSNIQYENQRMAALVGQLLELARTEKVNQQMSAVDMTRLVQEQVLVYESIAYEQGMKLEACLDENISVCGSAIQLKQLIEILLDNAISYGAKERPIQIHLQENRNEVILSVKNAGEEILPEQRELIFERFYRIDTARCGEDGHYGLGLAIAKNIVDAHNGNIGVDCYDDTIVFFVHLFQC